MLQNRFKRLITAIGEDSVALLEEKTVAIIGIGGVGGYACEGLARSGVGNIIIVDYDTVNETNINRQIIALDKTIGMLKTDVMEERIKEINPKCHVVKMSIPYNEETKELLFSHKIDFIIDAFDTIKGKIDLIKECQKRNIPLISSMGMANRLDPSKVKITTLDKTFNDPVARILRREIKFRVHVVFSEEVPLQRDILSSVMFVPSVAGIYLAYYVIDKLRRE